MSLDTKILHNIILGAPGVSRQGFGTALILGEATFTERVKLYVADDDYSGDTDLNAAIKAALSAAFAQSPPPARVAVGRWDITAVEAVEDALTACLEASSDWYGFSIETRSDADILDAADWAEASGRLFFAQSSDADMLTSAATDVASLIQALSFDHTAVCYYSDDNTRFDFSYLAGFLAFSFDETAPTACYKTVAGVAPDVDDTTAQANLEAKNANYYSTLKSLPATFGGTVADGHDVEHIVTGDWAKARIDEAIAQRFKDAADSGRRIPFSDQGFGVIEQAAMDVLKRGEDLGHFNAGTAEIQMPLRADVPLGDVQQGLLRWKWGAQYSGTVKEVSITGYVTLDFEGFGA